MNLSETAIEISWFTSGVCMAGISPYFPQSCVGQAVFIWFLKSEKEIEIGVLS